MDCASEINIYSIKFIECNGVIQGGILSPLLFNIYLEE